MITFATLGENLMRQYPYKKGKKKSRLMEKAIDKGTFGSTDKAWHDKKKKKYSLPKAKTGGLK